MHAPVLEPLSPTRDRAAVTALFDACADYFALERGRAAAPGDVDAFFNDRPPAIAAQNAHKLGVFQGTRLVGLVDLVKGYPGAQDWYLGLLLLAPQARDQGLGTEALEAITARARAAKATRLLLCVLHENTGAQLFWKRMGFSYLRRTGPVWIERKQHVKLEFVRML